MVWATGFKPNYPWLDEGLLDRKGGIIHDGGVMTQPGLYVLGLSVHSNPEIDLPRRRRWRRSIPDLARQRLSRSCDVVTLSVASTCVAFYLYGAGICAVPPGASGMTRELGLIVVMAARNATPGRSSHAGRPGTTLIGANVPQ